MDSKNTEMDPEAVKANSDALTQHLQALRPRRQITDITPDTKIRSLKRSQRENLPISAEKRRKSVDPTAPPPPSPYQWEPTTNPALLPEALVARLGAELFQRMLVFCGQRATTQDQFMMNISTMVVEYMQRVSPSSEACSSSSSTCARVQPVNSQSAPSSTSSASGTTSRTVAATRERKSYAAAAGRSAPMRSLSPAHPSAVMSGMDDLLRPERFDRLMNSPMPDQYTQEAHSWNPDDRSLNIFVKDEDKFTFHRHPVAQSTDCIRGKIGYSRGFHMWQIEWPERQRGTHAVVGVATKTAPLHATGYTALIGTTNESYGWDITRRECHHDSKHTMTWRYPFSNSRDSYHVPDKFYCILDMDEGYMAFATDDEYLGVAFRNLKGKTLYPIVAAVWGHCEISMRYLGSLEPEPLSLSEMCRRRVRIELGPNPEDHIKDLALPPILKQYLNYQC